MFGRAHELNFIAALVVVNRIVIVARRELESIFTAAERDEIITLAARDYDIGAAVGNIIGVSSRSKSLAAKFPALIVTF